MKKYNYIFVLFALLFCGCNDNTLGSGDGEHIVLPTKPYIYLDAAVNTKASLVEGTVLEDGFSVYGFTYDFNNKWETYRVTAKPNVFDNVPQDVFYTNSSYQYKKVKEWGGGKYTFFACYPQNLSVSDDAVEGTPYLTYTPNPTNAGNHVDIMTAMFEDTSLSSSPYVYFDFYHRLSAVDVVAMNFYEHSYDDPNAENTVITEKVAIDLVGLSLAFKNVQYESAKIYMDRRIPSECTLVTEGNNLDYKYVIYKEGSGSTLSIEYNKDSTLRPVTASPFDKSMIFIPQENTNLEVTTTVSYKKRRPNGQYVTDNNGSTVFRQTIPTSFNQPLKEGSRYYLQMTFTSAAVSISIITSDEWDDIKVDYEFE